MLSSVRLESANTYSGGTRLEAGELVVANNASLGSGTLTVAGEIYGSYTDALMYGYFFNEYSGGDFGFTAPVLNPDVADLAIANPIQLDSFFAVDVQIGLTDENLTLSGDIAGSGGLNKIGYGTLTLSGDNSNFDGGLYITRGTVNVAGDTSAGSGPIGFGGGTDQTLIFNSLNPSIGGLYEIRPYDDYYYSTAIVQLATGSTLTLDVDNLYLNFGGTIQGDGSVRITGDGNQMLSGYNSFTGGLEVAAGANLTLGSGSSLRSGATVTLDGGSLTLDGDEEDYFQIELLFGSNGGEIRGNGGFSFTNPLAIGSGVRISPGRSVGKIEFDGPLELDALGSLSVEIGDGDNAEVISDVVFANTINITATNSQPFSINLMGENGSLPTNFDPLQAYSWSVLLAGAAITNFDAMAFSLNVSNSLQNLGGEGLWVLQLGSSGNDFGETFLSNNVVLLSFTPVPEPSTFALVAIGLILVTLHAGRRRRA
ncbi:MAG: autotransporter-associated beta strand repeat-containing protein [bacterium]